MSIERPYKSVETNRDFIRNLSNIEMAEFFCHHFITGFIFMPEKIQEEIKCNIVRWLCSNR